MTSFEVLDTFLRLSVIENKHKRTHTHTYKYIFSVSVGGGDVCLFDVTKSLRSSIRS